MAESKTPTKISARNPVCRLCHEAKERRHVIRVFNKTGVDQELCQKVELSCGIRINENDRNSKVLCRSCVSFVNKICEFITKVRRLQNDEIVDEAFSVKRCVEVSPATRQPQLKRLSLTSSYRQPLSENPAQQQCENNVSTPIQCEQAPVDSEYFLSEKQRQMLSRAINAKDANVLAFILKAHCENVITALRKLQVKDLSFSSSKLCKRSQGSVLYGNDYESLAEFNYDKIWMELKDNFPLLIEFMNAVADREGKSIEDIGESLRIKYSFLYSILMSERWHELNLVKRVNTVLVIEGGCTKQVQ